MLEPIKGGRLDLKRFAECFEGLWIKSDEPQLIIVSHPRLIDIQALLLNPPRLEHSTITQQDNAVFFCGAKFVPVEPFADDVIIILNADKLGDPRLSAYVRLPDYKVEAIRLLPRVKG